MLQEPCSTPLMKPRERAGQDSMASDAPAGHSAPMPMPSSARNRNRNQKVGEKPAMKLQIEYHRIEIISGVLRPIRSASQPDAVAPDQPQPKRDREHDRHLGQRNVELLGDRHHDQQEDGEVEGVEGPAQPGGPPRQPLILGWLLPPRHGWPRAKLADIAYYLPGVLQNDVRHEKRRGAARTDCGRCSARYGYGTSSYPACPLCVKRLCARSLRSSQPNRRWAKPADGRHPRLHCGRSGRAGGSTDASRIWRDKPTARRS